ncbi:hypothetical protein LJR230_004368 [Trinickia sp. LjRoot230]|uniref:hypothetical protein n=1 Tax=Trinickia sp. LjRoot230 TaxID=3342288 RepID=UPI003ED08B7D
MPEQIHVSPNGTRYQLVATKTTTPTSDRSPKPVTVKMKTFWKTTCKWTDSDIADYRNSVPQLAEQIRTEQYWDRGGDVRTNRFTCEDFALRVLVQFAARRGLPLKFTSGVRTYRNMEVYGKPEHEKYDSTMFGFADMVELTYGAQDMQRAGSNTVPLSGPEVLRPGDVLAQANDRAGIAHHVQLVLSADASTITIMQGNSSGVIVRPFTTAMRVFGRNRADPQNSSYAGMPPENGIYTASGDGWNYKNTTKGTGAEDFLREFQFYRWNFPEFNR